MKRALEKAFRFLSSLRLTVVILGLTIMAVIPSTFIIQNREASYYLTEYPGAMGSLILACGYDRFYSSFFFLMLLGFFWVNLFFCTLKRFSGQLKGKGRGQYGPDILHLGILILILASLVSFAGGRKGSVYLKAGEVIQLSRDSYLIFQEFILEQYPDGRPKSWISRVALSDSPECEGIEYQISVNHPLRIDGFHIYQSGYRPSGRDGEYETGLMITSDPGREFVIASFFLIVVGLMITVIQKRKTL